jgi:hypothetical protein
LRRIIRCDTKVTMPTQSSDTSTHQLRARTVPVRSLEARVVDEAFSLFQEAYDGADRARFERDLREKDQIILLHDRMTGALKGFSTVLVRRMPGARRATVVFSGDTVIHRDYWGQKQLQIAFVRILLLLKARAPFTPLYWFLISKGYRTYMLLANAFPRAVPRHDRAEDPALRAALDTLAEQRFGAAYDPARGIVRLAAHERVRDGLAPITPRHLANAHVRFFAARNPGHVLGDELACLALVRLVDLLAVATRLGGALARRILGRRVSRASGPRFGVRHAEGA